MVKTVSKFSIRVMVALYAFMATTLSVFAQAGQEQVAPLFPTVQPTTLPTTADFGVLLTRIINYFLGLVGLIAVLMLVVGGIRYITSGGNDQALEKAKHTIMYALIGIVIVVLAYAIVFTITSTLRSF